MALPLATATETRRAGALRNGLALREAELRLLLLAGDVVAAAAGAALGPIVWAWFDPSFASKPGIAYWQLASIVLWPLFLRLFGGGDIAQPRFGRRSLRAQAQSFAAVGAIAFALFYVVPFFAPRGATLATLPLIAASLLVWRRAYLIVISSGALHRRVALLGADETTASVAKVLLKGDRGVAYRPVAFLVAEPAVPSISGIPVRSINEGLWPVVRELRIDELVIAHTRTIPDRALAELAECFQYGVAAIPATELYEQLTGRVMVAALEADWYAQLPTASNTAYLALKRALDVVAGLLLLALTLPLAAIVALVVLAALGHPLFYAQVRVGDRGRDFVMRKFRTMVRDAESDGRAVWASPDDPRVTRLGRFLRRTHLDELPQIWNVVRGEMSLVGPRPERPEFVAQLASTLPLYRARALVRPGITGWAQVEYPYASTVEDSFEKLEYDLYYIRHMGLLLDASIMLRTAGVMLRGLRR